MLRDTHISFLWLSFILVDKSDLPSVTPQNVILTQNVITIAAKCNINTKCNNIHAKCNKIINAKCNNFPTQNVITFLTQIVITPELQLCST